ncbi:hypothetical protein SLNWT_0484 [Streptomyces albus]|uniref:Uncharacterized protein n=1 Tax=Streptomyces albus (strain ATCC 21838 / DSM 41398 / FERM P-419 / JCM 4703 / NBRC 107858) TaxID=1081613 RepID=A0A0B5ENI6_STRA4|nr:hypothetical protein SLNWT_0484 [Streptomyces albus]AOU75172.1 hypothetical protein SLNHY_0481 [Streptomyces albus]AYN30978.1 hypothetical protein DUI70_0475 [Streptomyces albus]
MCLPGLGPAPRSARPARPRTQRGSAPLTVDGSATDRSRRGVEGTNARTWFGDPTVRN